MELSDDQCPCSKVSTFIPNTLVGLHTWSDMFCMLNMTLILDCEYVQNIFDLKKQNFRAIISKPIVR